MISREQLKWSPAVEMYLMNGVEWSAASASRRAPPCRVEQHMSVALAEDQRESQPPQMVTAPLPIKVQALSVWGRKTVKLETASAELAFVQS